MDSFIHPIKDLVVSKGQGPFNYYLYLINLSVICMLIVAKPRLEAKSLCYRLAVISLRLEPRISLF